MPNSLDLAPFETLTAEAVAAACRDAMDASDAVIARVVAVAPGERTFANTMQPLEEAGEHLAAASGVYGFMAYVSADPALREAAHEWEEKLEKYQVALAFRGDLYRAITEFAATPEAAALTGEDARWLAFELRDYRRSGFGLPEAQRQRVQALMDELVGLEVRFRRNIDEYDDGIVVTRDQLAGMPGPWVDALERVEEGGATRYRVSLDYPELHPFLANCPDRELRRQLFEKDQRKGGAANVAVLEQAIRIRAEVSALLGYDSWAAYRTEDRMARGRQAVEVFLAGLREKLGPKAAADMEEMRVLALERTGDRSVEVWDWRYWNNELLKERFAVDEFEVAAYFPLDAVLAGMFSVYQRVFGLRFVEAPTAPRWHPDVLAYDIAEAAGGAPFARFYMDLFPRPDKYGHAAAFTLRRGRRLDDGTYQAPVSAIVANFTRAGRRTAIPPPPR